MSESHNTRCSCAVLGLGLNFDFGQKLNWHVPLCPHSSTKSEDVVMKMEFGEDADSLEPVEETGLIARLSKKTKTQAKEKGKNDFSVNGNVPVHSTSVRPRLPVRETQHRNFICIQHLCRDLYGFMLSVRVAHIH